MTPKEFVAKHAKKLPPDPCYGIEPTNEDELLADFHAAVESLLPNRVEILSEGEKRFTTNTGVLQSDKYKGFVSGARFVLSRILEAIEQNVREK